MRSETTAGDISARVRHLESEVGEVKDGMSRVFGKLDQVSIALAGLQANKPINVMDGVRTGLQIMQTLVLLVGATVASIVYVSSNANNETLTVLKERQARLSERIGQVEQSAPWAARVAPAPQR